ncbi:MAG: low molecular weight phosphotyrosine protein phosphatase [Bdellovibrionales bacterium]|nr:low molecular weight phosphotyrosine protein phosphatase [Bdellovibrionales bacterium]
MEKIGVLFVCLGNICRSPTAEGVFWKTVQNYNLAERIIVDSAGCEAFHVGEPPDIRSQMAASKRGVDISSQRARQISAKDFELFDYILAMDKSNLKHLQQLKPERSKAKLSLFLNFAKEIREQEVPDPYYGGPDGFDRVIDLIEIASLGLIEEIVEKHIS